MNRSIDIYEFLRENGIDYQRFDHPAVFTCEQAERLVPDLPGAETKNLFLKDRKGKRHFLVVTGRDSRVDLAALKRLLGVSKLGFGSAERLERILGVTPGAVSILGLVADVDHQVELIFDSRLWDADAFCCHPLVNTATLVMSKKGLTTFLNATGHEPQVMEVPQRAGEE